MNQEGVSAITFEESYTVPPEQTAAALFARLPHGCGYADRMIECLATGYLVAILESICIREMQRHVDETAQTVVGRAIHIDHVGPIPPASPLRVIGWNEGLGNRSATFRIRVYDDHEVVCEARITLVAVERASLQARISTKLDALQGRAA